MKGKISDKVQVVEREIDEWSRFTRELDQRITELRNADISLGVAIISTSELKALEEQLATVKVCSSRASCTRIGHASNYRNDSM